MTLSSDQQAMLQLMLERGQTYTDLAELLGTDEAGVRSRARAALTELGGADPDRRVGLTDYLLGQADPVGRADAVRHLKDDPDDLELATIVSQKLRLLVPAAELPRLPGEQPGRRSRRLPRPVVNLPRPKTALSSGQSRLIAGLASGALILLVVVLAIAGVFSGGGGEASVTTTSAGSGNTGGPSDNAAKVTLNPAATGSATTGTAVFATAGQQPYVEVQLSGLPQPPSGKAYILWLLINGKSGHPLSPVMPDSNGAYHNQIPLQDFQVPIAQDSRFLDVSLSDINDLNKIIQRAVSNRTPVVPYQGTSVLRGALPTQPRSGQS